MVAKTLQGKKWFLILSSTIAFCEDAQNVFDILVTSIGINIKIRTHDIARN